jgi:hypothetical protein
MRISTQLVDGPGLAQNQRSSLKIKGRGRRQWMCCRRPLLIKRKADGRLSTVCRIRSHLSCFLHDGDALSGHQSQKTGQPKQSEPAPIPIIIPLVSSIIPAFRAGGGRSVVRPRVVVIVVVLRRDRYTQHEKSQGQAQYAASDSFEQVVVSHYQFPLAF